MKKRIFIGSSSEELGTAKIVQKILSDEFDVIIWNESVWNKSIFKLNNNFLTDLLSATLKFDFGILIGSPDDEVVVRDKQYLQARDNVLFELGLFVGRLGKDKCAFLVDDSVRIPTDFGGIKLAMFNKTNLTDKIEEIRHLFRNATNNNLNFFPSSTLAASYYENFAKYVCNYYVKNNGFDFRGKHYKKCTFKVIIPYSLSENVNIQFQQIQNKMDLEDISFKSTARSRNISVEAEVSDDKLVLIDLPTTLAGINHAISYLLPKDYRELNDDYDLIISRELDKFTDALSIILKRNNYEEFVIIERS